MEKQKCIMAIHDISGYGRCSLTVALPIISACGITAAALPTAVLSTHTGEIQGYTRRDLTEDMKAYADHWKSLGLEFDAIFTGYLGSERQTDIVADIIDEFSNDKTIVIIDPAMADNGVMYQNFEKSFAEHMGRLCRKADYIVPNMTEAAFITGQNYSPNYGRKQIEDTLRSLAGIVRKGVVITGVSSDDETLGAAYIDKVSGKIGYSMSKKYEGIFYGTGDVFASCFSAMLVNGCRLAEAVERATHFTAGSIKTTVEQGTDRRYGVAFEKHLEYLTKLCKN